MLLHAQARDALLAKQLRVLRNILNTVHPALGPALEHLCRLALFMILAKEGIVTLVISLHRGRMRSQRDFADRADQEPWNHGAVWVAIDDLARHGFLRADDHLFGCAPGFDHDAEVAP